MALELTLAFFTFWFYTRPGEISDLSLSLFSGGTALGCTEDAGYADDGEGDEEVLQLISLIDSRCRPEGSSGARCKTTGARAEARAVGTIQPLAPEVTFVRCFCGTRKKVILPPPLIGGLCFCSPPVGGSGARN